MANSGVFKERHVAVVWCVGQLEGGSCAAGGERYGKKGRLGPDISGSHAIVVKPRVLDPCWNLLAEHEISAYSS